jgi:hypothetical protein
VSVNQGNLATADEILSPEAVSHAPGGVRNVGPATLLRTAIPDRNSTLKLQLSDGDSRWLQGSGQPIEFEEIRIDRFAGGRIVESWFIPTG